MEKMIIIENLKNLIGVVSVLKDIDLNTIKEIEDYVSFNPEGVICLWNDCVFYDLDDAIEVMKEDKRAIGAAFKGYITFEDFPHIINNYNGQEERFQDSEEVYLINNAFIELKEMLNDIENEYEIMLFDIDLDNLVEELTDFFSDERVEDDFKGEKYE